MEDEKNENNEYKRILQCPLCSKIPLIGLSMDEQSNTFIQTFCKGDGSSIHCCFISIKTYMKSLNKGIKTMQNCYGCNCVLGDSLFCESCKKCFCFDDGLFHKISKECNDPIKKLNSFKQFDYNCLIHKFEICNAYCNDCKRNICDECILNEKLCSSHEYKLFKDCFLDFNDIEEKSKEKFKELFENVEKEIEKDSQAIEYNEKEKWKNKFFKDNKFIILLYEHIYDNFKFFEKIGFYDENVCENFKRFQYFNVNQYNPDSSNLKVYFENFLKGRDTKYDLSQIFLNLFELVEKEKKQDEEVKVFKEDKFQDGKFIGLFDEKCLNLISGKYKIDDDNNLEKRLIGKYIWKEKDYYYGLWDEQNYFHKFGEYYFNVGENIFDIYIGGFEHGEMNGDGLYIWGDDNNQFNKKEFYYGEWKNDKREGRGKYIWADNYIYIGLFEDNQKSDNNAYIYLDLDFVDDDKDYKKIPPISESEMNELDDFNNFYYYRGSFKNDYRSGHGEILYKDQSMYIGDFKNSKRNGNGILYKINKEGKTIELSGKWEDNIFKGNSQ